MKKLILSVFTLIVIFGLSGCTIKHELKQDKAYTDFKSKEMYTNKISIENISIEKMNYIVERKPNGFMGSANLLIIDNNFNERNLEAVLEQYFKNVSIDTEAKNDIKIISKLKDFRWEPLYGGQLNEFFIEMEVFYKNKSILKKEYHEIYAKRNLIASLKLSLNDLTEAIISQNLFELYETKFIPDLKEALSKSI
ncbi:MAG: hypothetical protein RBT22_10165 [Aliarcobacter sp.]|jgi:hypothetical protein|nr:hypothetical protein [Aliarcobacter sp.]